MLDVIKWPNSKLKLISAKVEAPVNPSFVKELFETVKYHGGVGLSAIQVGLPVALFVVNTKREIVVCNPSWLPIEDGSRVAMLEGCLSIPGQFATTKRFSRINVKYLNEYLEPVEAVMEGLDAQVFQHETEHMVGKFFTDHLPSAERSRILAASLKKNRKSK